jgi:hypothetical protein
MSRERHLEGGAAFRMHPIRVLPDHSAAVVSIESKRYVQGRIACIPKI